MQHPLPFGAAVGSGSGGFVGKGTGAFVGFGTGALVGTGELMAQLSQFLRQRSLRRSPSTVSISHRLVSFLTQPHFFFFSLPLPFKIVNFSLEFLHLGAADANPKTNATRRAMRDSFIIEKSILFPLFFPFDFFSCSRKWL